MRLPIKIELTNEERLRLEKNVRSRKTPQSLIERSNIILLSAEGFSNKEISEKLSISEHKAGRWRARYAEKRYVGIEKELPRGLNHGGKKTVDQAKIRLEIIETTTNQKPENATHWSTRTLAEKLHTSHVFVARVWKECGFKPHLIRTFKISKDPKFEEKLSDVIGLYLNPPENAVVFCIDEKSQIQALDRTQPSLPLKKGRCGTMTHDYKRNGTSTLFAALDVLTGKVIGECTQRHRHIEFLKFMKRIDKEVPDKDKEIHVIVDNYATHKHNKIKNWLLKHKRFKFHFTPTSSSWLNLVERFFGLLTEKALKRGVFNSVDELNKAIIEFLENLNINPKPFIWTKSVSEIMEKVGRARKVLNYVQSI